jgi:hypothetical protein
MSEERIAKMKKRLEEKGKKLYLDSLEEAWDKEYCPLWYSWEEVEAPVRRLKEMNVNLVPTLLRVCDLLELLSPIRRLCRESF